MVMRGLQTANKSMMETCGEFGSLRYPIPPPPPTDVTDPILATQGIGFGLALTLT